MSEKRQIIRDSFLKTLFSFLGYVANCDGQINRSEVKRIKFYMNKMELTEAEQHKALLFVKAGTSTNFNAGEILLEFRKTTTPKLVQIMLVYLITMAKTDGHLSKKELHAIQWVARELGYKSVIFNHLLRIIYAQDQAAARRDPHKPEHSQKPIYDMHQQTTPSQGTTRKNPHHQHANQNNHSNHAKYQNPDLQKAYGILGVTSEMTDDDIRRHYQKLVSQLHPDKLASQGLSTEQLTASTERFKRILIAYEFIKKYRSIYTGTR